MPDPGDARWRSAPRASTRRPTRYLPFGRPFVPDLGDRLDWLHTAARLVLLADGYPARLTDRGVAIHPLDGRYLLEALLAEQAEHQRRQLAATITRTAWAIVRRAESVGGALVMRYRDTASSMVDGHPHISALPQAYYAAALTRAGRLLGDDALQASADRFFRVLLLAVNDGGALYRSGHDVALALVPTRPRDLVLNGWLSALVAVHAYAELRPSKAAHQLFAENLPTLRRLLPLYDAPSLKLSRYALSGPQPMRLTWTPATDRIVIEDIRILVPGESEIRLPAGGGGRWSARAFADDVSVEAHPDGTERLIPHRDRMRFSAVLSRAPLPRENRVRFRLLAPTALELSLDALVGRYDPMASGPVERTWARLATRHLAPGAHDVDIALPYRAIDLFAYPTNFTRGGPDERVNSYHGTHIVRLRQLASITGDPLFAEWADRWSGYVSEWRNVPGLEEGVCRTPEGSIDGIAQS